MADETITFELIRKIQREEQRSPKLSKLPDNFYSNVKSYLKQKKKMSEASKRNNIELKNIERLVEDIFDRRERKIVTNAVMYVRNGVMIEDLTDEERKLFESVVQVLKERRDKAFSEIFETENQKKEVAELIVFKEDVPEFLGADLKTYGPFKKGDIAKIPEANIRILLEKGIAESFQVEK